MNTQIIPLVEQLVVDRLKSHASFTALDISNALKSDRYPVTHREVAEIVRDIYGTGAMDFYDYDRRLIDVTTGGGAKNARTFLYLHNSTKEREYTDRQQSSLPRVAPDTARDLADSGPAGPVSVLPRPQRRSKSGVTSVQRLRQRRDGALAIPRALISRLGWIVGMSIGLTIEDERVRLMPDGDIPVQVWNGQRVRICKRKLGSLIAGQVTVEIDGNGIALKVQA